MVPLSEAEGIRTRKPANNLAGVVHHDMTVVDLVKSILNFAIAFEKEFNKNFVTTGILDIVRDMMCSIILTEMRAQCYNRYIRIAKIQLENGIILALVERFNGGDAG